jgi:hypothetical protein
MGVHDDRGSHRGPPDASSTPSDPVERWAGRGLLGALLAWTFLVVAVCFRAASRTGGVATSADSITPWDQLQYLAWTRESADHVLISNLFDLSPSRRVFFHPLFSVSGLVSRAGVDLRAAFLFWKPVAVLVLFFGFRAYARRFLRPRVALAATAAALLLPSAGFALSHWNVVSGQTGFETNVLSVESFPLVYLQGFAPIAIAVGLMPVFLLALEAGIDPARSGRRARSPVVIASAVGLLVSWLHPWQGEVLLAVMFCMFVWRPDRLVLVRWLPPAIATLLPVAYYFALSRVSAPWEIAARQNDVGAFHLGAVAIVVVPFAIAAAFGVRRPLDRQSVGLLAWPVAAIVGYYITPAVGYHLFEGITLPLVVLAARADWARVERWRLPAIAVGVVLCVVGTTAYVGETIDVYRRDRDPYDVTSGDDRAALDWLDSYQRPGGVLTTAGLGASVPAFTGRATWVGHPSWTPGFQTRADEAQRFVQAQLTQAEVERILREARPAFVLAGCGSSPALAALLPASTTPHHFGCATVYELDAA